MQPPTARGRLGGPPYTTGVGDEWSVVYGRACPVGQADRPCGEGRRWGRRACRSLGESGGRGYAVRRRAQSAGWPTSWRVGTSSGRVHTRLNRPRSLSAMTCSTARGLFTAVFDAAGHQAGDGAVGPVPCRTSRSAVRKPVSGPAGRAAARPPPPRPWSARCAPAPAGRPWNAARPASGTAAPARLAVTSVSISQAIRPADPAIHDWLRRAQGGKSAAESPGENLIPTRHEAPVQRVRRTMDTHSRRRVHRPPSHHRGTAPAHCPRPVHGAGQLPTAAVAVGTIAPFG